MLDEPREETVSLEETPETVTPAEETTDAEAAPASDAAGE